MLTLKVLAASLVIGSLAFASGAQAAGCANKFLCAPVASPYKLVPLTGANKFLSGNPQPSPYHQVNLGGVNTFLSGGGQNNLPYHQVNLGCVDRFLCGH